jgi:hypothetical protein
MNGDRLSMGNVLNLCHRYIKVDYPRACFGTGLAICGNSAMAGVAVPGNSTLASWGL